MAVQSDLSVHGDRRRRVSAALTRRTSLLDSPTWHGKAVLTSIFKAPVEGRVLVRRLNVAGDEHRKLPRVTNRSPGLYAS
jgi:hypothetical protein